MKIGIEAERANLQQPTGVEHYAQQLILALAKIDGSAESKNTYLLYLRAEPSDWIKRLPPNFSWKVMPFPFFWTQLRISWEMLVHPVDALFIMASALPIIHPHNSTVTIHDIAWDFYPQTFSRLMLSYLRFSTWFACLFAAKIIAVSLQTKKDLLRKYNIPAEKIHVIYHGFDQAAEMSREFTREQQAEDAAKLAKLPEKFVVYLGTLQPRKNIIGLIDAFISLKKQLAGKKQQLPGALVIAGGQGWLYGQIMDKIHNHPEVIYLGYFHDRFALLTKADLLVLPSFYEGFGMTILDAFAAGVPVATSAISSMPEVAGDAAEYFDPHDTRQIRQAMHKVLTEPGLRLRLAEAGRKRLAQFSWQRCAQQTLALLRGD